ncbi:struthiocalcin-1-like [Ambystoma mexicanum]|uniref:struthiocalcin-1-like n=1 Tax=Ambystoma mexicanum TaxID=8296 RepID=UPI0037E87E1A
MTGIFILSLSLITIPSALPREDCLCFEGCCENDWFQYRDSCYKPFQTLVKWKEAEEKCRKIGAVLTSIHSEEENDFIYALMGRLNNYKDKKAYWIGALSQKDQSPRGSWCDDSAWDYDKFGDGQPDGLPGEFYVGSWVEKNGKITWNDYGDSYTFQYICKKAI